MVHQTAAKASQSSASALPSGQTTDTPTAPSARRASPAAHRAIAWPSWNRPAARAAGITLIIVGHLGRNRKWRGPSGKADMLAWTLQLARDEDSDDDQLVGKSKFDKFRRARDGNGPLRWTIRATPVTTSPPPRSTKASSATNSSPPPAPAALSGASPGTIPTAAHPGSTSPMK
jgi:hypothetical protein